MTAIAYKTPAAPLDVSTDRRHDIAEALNANLAQMVDLAASAKQAHWNVHGPNFQGLHELFDTVAAETREWSDMLAERAVAIGHLARGTIQDAAAGTNLEPFPDSVTEWTVLVEAMLDRMSATAGRLRAAMRDLEDDLATQDLYIEIIRGLEKRAWMVSAHLDAR